MHGILNENSVTANPEIITKNWVNVDLEIAYENWVTGDAWNPQGKLNHSWPRNHHENQVPLDPEIINKN